MGFVRRETRPTAGSPELHPAVDREDLSLDVAILIQRENPALPVSDVCSDAQSEPRSEQGGSESRKLW